MTSNYPFVSKLYSMLTDTENSAFISWSPEGGAFFVWNPTEFSASVLPKYFKHNNFCSFVRQLNIYGFHKVENENWMFTHDEKLFQRDAPESIAKIQRRRQTKRSGTSNADESEDYIAHMPPTKKSMEEPSFATPTSIVHTPVSVTHQTKPSPMHMPLMSPHSHSHSNPMTPATPHGVISTTSTSTFQAMMTPTSVSAVSSASSIDDDIAYLKTMNGMLVSELSQMKRKTQTQEDTITWLIQELARTQRHVEMISSGSQPSQTSTPSQPPSQVLNALGNSNMVEITGHLPAHSHSAHAQTKLKMELTDSNGLLPTFTPHTPSSNNSGLVYTPQSTSSTASYHYDPNTNSGLSNSSGMPTDFSDPFQFQDSNTFVYGEEAPLI